MNTRPFSWMLCASAFLAFMVLCPLRCAARSQSPLTDLRGQVIDENGQPVPRVEVDLRFGSGISQTIYTDTVGRFQLRTASISQVHLSLSKPGFFRIEDRVLDLAPGVTEVTLTLNHETEVKEQLEVQSEPVQIDPDTTSHQESLVQHEIVNVPVPSSHDLQQSLRTIPQVLADASGRLHVAGGRQGQTEVLLDGFEINDPASGNFTSKVDVDAVRTVTIETGGYGAQYAHASAGILALDTQSGDDRWRYGVTNFIPDVSLQQGLHLGNWYPRLSTSGPLRKGKAWFSDALSIQRNFVLVSELPIGQNIDTIWSGDNLLRGQLNLTSRNVLQGSFLFNGSTDPRRGLGVFSPLSTTSNSKSRRYFVSVKDQIWVGRTLIDVGAAVDTGGTDSNPQGTLPFVVTPSSASGNYFQSYFQQSRWVQRPRRLSDGQHAVRRVCAGPLETVETDRFFGGCAHGLGSLDPRECIPTQDRHELGSGWRRANEIHAGVGEALPAIVSHCFWASVRPTAYRSILQPTAYTLHAAGRLPDAHHCRTASCEFIFGASPRTATAAVIQHNSRVAGEVF